jgi:hypothetical protein
MRKSRSVIYQEGGYGANWDIAQNGSETPNVTAERRDTGERFFAGSML